MTYISWLLFVNAYTLSTLAMNKLLEHSMKGPSVGKAGAMAKYIKQGDLNTAVKDFHAVKPVVYNLPASGIYNAKVSFRNNIKWSNISYTKRYITSASYAVISDLVMAILRSCDGD